mmetsp:Transcript_51357/g.76203  ORF Transcript_51357/g.76203 Transcript_51357/m.76203 type:complete len:268 (+) Transcript_51357:86-889(+)|eukprot:CAMPEP_0195522590 /NCGR_PEP_ID=MMETSP0794_2-20130614/20874_1 /TAXON_ID=515487 /ORGANISM="Stephanopyxis turris, Strain CCMP 815" /LENGTH=267 /DNA_ID=CAMNT_0040652377 /DNA_START=56 /DNA_END=859 /DNA_ORIENTATION=+
MTNCGRRCLIMCAFVAAFCSNLSFVKVVENGRSLETVGSYEGKRIANREKDFPANYPKVLVYMTTHMSESHVGFLEYCWPKRLAELPLLQHADYLFFTSKDINETLLTPFGTNVKIERYEPKGKQEGAMLAMTEATKQGWFDGYDWIIRVNPDVVILDDTWLQHALFDDSNDAILSPCGRKMSAINTDFFAYRPKALSNDAWQDIQDKNNEQQATLEFSSLIQNGTVVLLPGNRMNVRENGCRVSSKTIVVHNHSLKEQCKVEAKTS